MTSLYFILADMIKYSKQNLKDKVMELNEKVNQQLPKQLSLEWVCNYDNIRQSCIMSFIHPELREIYLKDAQERYKRIGKI